MDKGQVLSLTDVEAMLRGSDLLFAYVDTLGDLAAFARADRRVSQGVSVRCHRPRRLPRHRPGRPHLVHDVAAANPTLSRVASIELYCKPELAPFYEALGFTSDVDGILLMRRKLH